LQRTNIFIKLETISSNIYENLRLHQLEYAIKRVDSLYIGITKAVGVGYDHTNKDYIAIVKSFEKDDDELLLKKIGMDNDLYELRRKKMHFTWVKPEDVPFGLKQETDIDIKHPDLFEEFKNNVLLIRLHNSGDNRSDLLYLYIVPSFSSASYQNAKTLSVEFKSIAGGLIANAVRTLVEEQETFKNQVNFQYEFGNHIVENLKSEVTNKENEYVKGKQRILDYSKFLLEEIGKEKRLRFHFSEDANTHLSEKFFPIEDLRKILEDATSCAMAFQMPIDNDFVIIEPYHININSFEKPQLETIQTEEESSSRYARTVALLDRLENAARVVMNNREKLTSVNVGKSFPTPVTAPAISDSLKKNKAKITHLFDTYPDKWQIIRLEFRPIKNLLAY